MNRAAARTLLIIYETEELNVRKPKTKPNPNHPGDGRRKGCHHPKGGKSQNERHHYIVASSQLTQIYVAEDTRPLVTELKRIGNNLNQISMKINAGAFQSYNFQEVIEMQRSIYEALLRIGGSQWRQ